MQSTELKSIKNNENYVCSFSYSDHQNKFVLNAFYRIFTYKKKSSIDCEITVDMAGAPNESIVQNHLSVALLNVF